MNKKTEIIRNELISLFWDYHNKGNAEAGLPHIKNIPLDHFAIIDLGYGASSKKELLAIFEHLGFKLKGLDYLPDKKNEFLWARSNDKSLPQAVLADFRIEEFSSKNKLILEKYARYQKPINQKDFSHYLASQNYRQISLFLFNLLNNRPWPIPTVHDYYSVLEENELAAWVLAFGRTINHFGMAVHLTQNIRSLEHLHSLLPPNLKLNTYGGTIKGGPQLGITQSSTLGPKIKLQLEDGFVPIRSSFIEFVWRYKKASSSDHNYYDGFIGANANQVIESLYQ